MITPSLSNYNTRSQMALHIPLCRTNKGQKSMSFLDPKISNKLNSNIKTAATTASATKNPINFFKSFKISQVLFQNQQQYQTFLS